METALGADSGPAENHLSSESAKAERNCLQKLKRKWEDSGQADELSMCGICLADVVERGRLDCCQHCFCFDCIMQWSKVESRCPLCKQRFKRVTRGDAQSSGSKGSLRTPRSVLIPLKDQVYQPSEEDLAAAMEPYANTVCMVCLESDNEHLLLLCDLCDGAAHTYCVGLGQQVPDGDWYCSTCSGEREGSSTDGDASVDPDALSAEESSSDTSDSEGGPKRFLSDEDNETQFSLNVELNIARPEREGPVRADGAASSRRLRSSGRAARARVSGEGRSSREGRPVRSRQHRARHRNRRLSTAFSEERQARGLRARARRAASGVGQGGDGLARTVQTQVDARLHARLQLVRDQWGSIRQGVLAFPQRPGPQQSPQATPLAPPPSGAGSLVEKLAWKAMRALQSGEQSRGQASREQGGEEAGSSEQAHEKGQMQAAKDRKMPPRKIVNKSLGQSAAVDVRRGLVTRKEQNRSGAVCQGPVLEKGGDEEGCVADTWKTLEEARRRVNAEWVDEELLQQLQEPHPPGGSQERHERQRRVEHAHPFSPAAPLRHRHLHGTGGRSKLVSAGAGGTYHQQRRLWPEKDRELDPSNDWESRKGVGVEQVRLTHLQRREGHFSGASAIPAPKSQEGNSEQLQDRKGNHGPVMAATPPVLLPSVSSGLSSAERSLSQTFLQHPGLEAVRETSNAWKGPQALEPSSNRTEGPHQVFALPAEDGQGQGRRPGVTAPASTAVSGGGLAAAKHVKEKLAEAVKKQLGPLYKSKVIDRDQFRRIAEGASRALLLLQPAQTLYEKVKLSGVRPDAEGSILRCWSCQRSLERQAAGQPFCPQCIERQISLLMRTKVANR